jgi:hypothetical protein
MQSQTAEIFLGSVSVTVISLSLTLMLLQAYSMSEEEVQTARDDKAMHFQQAVLHRYVLFCITESYECLHISRW